MSRPKLRQTIKLGYGFMQINSIMDLKTETIGLAEEKVQMVQMWVQDEMCFSEITGLDKQKFSA